MHWGRETFALAIAVQNLVWGIDAAVRRDDRRQVRHGRVVVGGAAALRARPRRRWRIATTPLMLRADRRRADRHRAVRASRSASSPACSAARIPPEKRSMALGISAAAGSFGQFALLPLTQWLLSHVGWYGALLALAAVALLMVPLAAALVERQRRASARVPAIGRPGDARSAGPPRLHAADGRLLRLRLPGRVHRRAPARLSRRQGAARRTSRVTALALIGLFNIVGTYVAGWLGGRMPQDATSCRRSISRAPS